MTESTLHRRHFLAQSLRWCGGALAATAAAPLWAREPRDMGAMAWESLAAPQTGLSPLDLNEYVAGLTGRDRFGREIALTFDDGPSPAYTRMILRGLAQTGLHGTFFVVGRRVEKHPDLVRQMVDEGHSLGNHTWSHPNLGLLSKAQIHDELTQTQDAVDHALGGTYRMQLVRPPYGAPFYGRPEEEWRERQMAKVASVLTERQEFCILWQMASGDSGQRGSPQHVLTTVQRQLKRRHGGVMVMHPRNGRAAPVFEQIAAHVLESEFEEKTIPDLLEFKYGASIDDVVTLPTLNRWMART